MTVDPPDVILASKGALITNTGSSPILVTITGESGQQETVEVPGNSSEKWYPPAGWRSAAFRANGQGEEFRMIDQEASAS